MLKKWDSQISEDKKKPAIAYQRKKKNINPKKNNNYWDTNPNEPDQIYFIKKLNPWKILTPKMN